MNQVELFKALLGATRTAEVNAALSAFESTTQDVQWLPVGRENNKGTIEASSDPGRSLIERLTNGIDAVLEDEFVRHKGKPECQSPRDAAQAWLGVPAGGLSELSTKDRQRLADRVSIQIREGDGEPNQRLIIVEDRGTGILPEFMPATILSLSESNKITKRYVVGAYGQGGSSTFACSQFTLIASRFVASTRVGFTVVRYYEPPPDEEAKVGNYVYLTLQKNVLEIDTEDQGFPVGTHVRHFGYDLTKYSGSLGPGSVYGLLNNVLFDPVMPVWLNDAVHSYRRVIKGSRNALNGAVDEGDDERKEQTISHHIPMYHVDLSDMGVIGLEYWVLEPYEKQPIRAFVEPSKPIVLTLHGQSHAEMSQLLVRRDAELPYLRQRLIVHVDCNRLTPGAKRALFVSNREEARRGRVYSRIEEEVVKALKSDDELSQLNSKAREEGLHHQDQEAQKHMQAEVARLLRLHGMHVEPVGGTPSGKGDDGPPAKPRPPRPKPMPIEIHEPPTFVKIVWDESEPMTFYPEQSRYVRIETDAESSYHNAADPKASRLNFIVSGEGLAFAGSTPLSAGRMRAIIRCEGKARVGAKGVIRVELARVGLPALVDAREFEIVNPPVSKQAKRSVSVPRIDPRPIDPSNAQWDVLNWRADDPSYAASFSEMENGTLVVWYSTIFPGYAKEVVALENRDPALAKSFGSRYAIWLAVHSLLLQEESESRKDVEGIREEALEEIERLERCRIARMSAMIALREIRDLKAASGNPE